MQAASPSPLPRTCLPGRIPRRGATCSGLAAFAPVTQALAQYTNRSIISIPLERISTNQELMDMMFDQQIQVGWALAGVLGPGVAGSVHVYPWHWIGAWLH